MLFGFKPARRTRVEDVRVVADLDRLISEPVGFRFNGKIHVIKPMTQAVFFKVVNELASLDLLRQKKGFDPVEVREGYYKLFMRACDSITKQDCMSMTDSQIGALVQNILDCVSGRAQAEEKKKTLNPSNHVTH